MKPGRIWRACGLGLLLFAAGACQVAGVSLHDDSTGLSFSVPEQYRREPQASGQGEGSNRIVAGFVRSNPSAVITVRRETGLRKATSVLRRSMTDHFMNEIRQFFPVRYGKGYESIFLREREIAGKEGVEHAFHFVTSDGIQRTMRILLVPWDDDTAYYLILESGRFDFDKVDADLDVLERTLKLPGLK